MKKTLLLSTIISVTFCVSVFAKDNVNSTIQKIGIVNPVATYQSTPQGEDSLKALQNKLKPEAEKLQKQQNDLLQEKQKLHNDAPGMTAENLKQEEVKQMNKENQFQQAFTEFRQSGAEAEQKLAQNFQEAFNTAVSEVAKKQCYDLILSSQAIAYVVPNAGHDITTPVIEKMQALGKTSKDADKNKK